VVGIRSREKSICGGKGSYMYDAKIFENVTKQMPILFRTYFSRNMMLFYTNFTDFSVIANMG
jgi:hypothetical protein